MRASMKSIYKLLILDYYVIKVLSGFVAAAILVALAIGFATQPGMLIMVILTFTAFLLSVLFSVAEKSNFNKLYGTLPVKKTEIVIGRYLFAALAVFLLSIIAFLLFCASSMMLKANIEWFTGAAYWALAFIITTFFISIQFPLYFRFEYSRAMIISILPYILFFAVGFPLFGQLMKQSTFFSFFMNAFVFFQSHIYLMILLGVGAGLILLTASTLISLILIRKKQA